MTASMAPVSAKACIKFWTIVAPIVIVLSTAWITPPSVDSQLVLAPACSKAAPIVPIADPIASRVPLAAAIVSALNTSAKPFWTLAKTWSKLILPMASSIFPTMPSRLMSARAFARASTARIPCLLRPSKAGSSLLLTVSFRPSIAWSTVLASLAILPKLFSSLPTAFMASKKSFVAISPFWTAWTIWSVLIPMCLATAAIPAGVCSSISLKSCQATVGLAAIWTPCWLKVFMACCGFSAAAAIPPKPVTSWSVLSIPTAASWAYVLAMSDAL